MSDLRLGLTTTPDLSYSGLAIMFGSDMVARPKRGSGIGWV
jgi:hypothetical protein